MPRYIRAYIPGGSYFFTVGLLERQRHLLTENIEILREAFRIVRNERPFQIDAIVILPEHLHCIWTLPPNDADFSTRWRLLKSYFSRAIEPGERISNRRHIKCERGIWQRRFWEHCIRDQDDFNTHVDYIHYNPVKHGWVSRAIDWPYSSFHKFIRSGIYPLEWAATTEVRELDLE